MEAAAILSEFRIRQLPVVNTKKELVGYINRTNVKRAFCDILGITQ
jgi:CBS domain-containing protein